MSRSKKNRNPSLEETAVTRNRTQSNVDGRQKKRLKNRKGNPSGTKHSQPQAPIGTKKKAYIHPKLGSKKKIELISQPKKEDLLRELELLQNNPMLLTLKARLSNGEQLGEGLLQELALLETQIKRLKKKIKTCQD